MGRPLHEAYSSDCADSAAFGYICVYVDDFLIVSDDPFIEAVKAILLKTWKVTDKPTVHFGDGTSIEYLSVNITAEKTGWFLDQHVYCQDLLAKWSMDECRAIGSLEDVQEQLEDEQEHDPDPGDVRTAQRLAGGLNWLATRTRPDISFVVSQLSSAATRAPLRAIALGKKCLRYLSGTREHGIRLHADTHRLRGGGSEPNQPVLEAFGDASYETGYAQTGVLVKYRGMLIFWKSAKQPQVPRSTAESECTAMAHSSQYLEGIMCLFHSMRVTVFVPTLWCDNRAACHLTAGSSEWRTKALVNKIMGVKSLIELGVIVVLFKATSEMEADFLTKFMGAQLMTKQRARVGCVPWRA